MWLARSTVTVARFFQQSCAPVVSVRIIDDGSQKIPSTVALTVRAVCCIELDCKVCKVKTFS